MKRARSALAALAILLPAPALAAQLAVRAELLHTQTGEPIRDGVVVVRDGRIEAVGPAATTRIPDGFRVVAARVAMPGLIDTRTVVGLSGVLNQPHDQDMLEKSGPMQPELRALDAFDAREPLVAWVRRFGVTTIHTGHAPGMLLGGQTILVKTAGRGIPRDLLRDGVMVVATLGDGAGATEEAPGTRAKAAAMLRSKLIAAREYATKRAGAEPPARDLALDALARVTSGEIPLLVTAHRAHDILTALRIRAEFGIPLVLDGAAEAYLLLDEIRAAGVTVLPHAAMARQTGALRNGTFELAARLRESGIPFAFQSGYESYVPKTRVVLFEAAVAAANGLGPDAALAALTIDAARLLGIDQRVGSLAPGKDADLALFDGDPFEFTTHCTGVLIDGEVFPGER